MINTKNFVVGYLLGQVVGTVLTSVAFATFIFYVKRCL